MRNILIGGAWPYANGVLHIGHIAALLPGDVLARYHRACGDHVCFVSGSDCHGTPVALRAKKEGKTPREISDQYHKDNIPFHTIILPSLLMANGLGWHLPDQIISSEYLTLEGRKISTSQNYAIWVKDLVGKYDADSIRYFFLVNGPEKKDADFSWREFVNSHNGELLGAYGNFINRSLSFIAKYWNGIVPEGALDQDILRQIEELFTTTGRLIEKGACKDAISGVFDFIRKANKYFDTEAPWITRTTNEKACRNTLFQCTQIIANLAVLLAPFLPFSSQKVCEWLDVPNQWRLQSVPCGYHLPKIQLLFERLDKNVITQEEEKLKKLSEA